MEVKLTLKIVHLVLLMHVRVSSVRVAGKALTMRVSSSIQFISEAAAWKIPLAADPRAAGATAAWRKTGRKTLRSEDFLSNRVSSGSQHSLLQRNSSENLEKNVEDATKLAPLHCFLVFFPR